MKQNIKVDSLTGINWIDSNSLFLAVKAVLNKDIMSCDELEDHEVFEEIDSEMMKRGTLAHGSIRWEWVCEQCASLLQNEAKDLRLLLYILQSLPNLKNCPSPLTLGAVLTAHFISIWGEAASPPPKRRSAPARKIVDALEALTDHALKYGISQELVEITGDALRQLPDFFIDINTELRESLLSLPRRVEEAAAVEEVPISLPVQKAASKPTHSAAAVQQAHSGSEEKKQSLQPLPEGMVLDTKNERGLKQNVTTIADFMLGLDVCNPLSYRLRRFATWYGVSSPPVKQDEKTVIQPVSENAADSYRQAAGRGQADVDIVQKLERSCHLQPFWIEGHYLSYQLAVVCGREKAAEAILEETGSFVLSHDWFFRLQFSNGAPFVNEDTRKWLANAKQKGMAQDNAAVFESTGADHDMQGFIHQVRKKASSGQTQEAIEMLENSRLAQQNPRETALWELLVMECLSDWGMKHLVSLQARRLEAEIAEKTVSNWEPDLLKRVKRLTKAR